MKSITLIVALALTLTTLAAAEPDPDSGLRQVKTATTKANQPKAMPASTAKQKAAKQKAAHDHKKEKAHGDPHVNEKKAK